MFFSYFSFIYFFASVINLFLNLVKHFGLKIVLIRLFETVFFRLFLDFLIYLLMFKELVIFLISSRIFLCKISFPNLINNYI